MNFAIAAAVFPIIFIGELPDKTMFASLVMSTRGRPGAVWLGAAAAFVVHVAIATIVGVALFHVVPRRVLDVAVAAMFLAGAGLAVREARQGQRREARPEAIVEEQALAHRRRKVAATAFVVVFLAEWGDLTQILTANLAAHYHSPVSVGLGAVVALWAAAAIAVLGGQSILRFVKITTVHYATAAMLIGLAAYVASTAI